MSKGPRVSQGAGAEAVAEAVTRGLRGIARGIIPPDAIPWRGPNGEHVDSLTEAAIYMGGGLHRIAEALDGIGRALDDLADAVKAKRAT